MGGSHSTALTNRLQHSTIDSILQDDEFIQALALSALSLSEKSQRNLAFLGNAINRVETTSSSVPSAAGSESQITPLPHATTPYSASQVTLSPLLTTDESTFHINLSPPVAAQDAQDAQDETTIHTPLRANPTLLLKSRKDLRCFLTLNEKDVNLPESITREYEHWSNDWRIFFSSTDFDVSNDGGPIIFLGKQYNNTTLLRSRRAADRIRWRLYMLFFYWLHRIYGIHQPLITLICRSGLVNDAEVANANLAKWIANGQKYHCITSLLGGVGCLFMLPQSVSESIWESRLPLKGGFFEAAASILEGFRIIEKASSISANAVGAAILQGLLLPIESISRRTIIPSSTRTLPVESPKTVGGTARDHVTLIGADIPRANASSDYATRAAYGLQSPSSLGATQMQSEFHYRSQQVFNRIPIPMPYDSPIFVCVQNGDVIAMVGILSSGKASIDAVDPYGLGLLYYATYYCWRSSGAAAAMRTCKALLDLGVNTEWVDDLGNTPMHTLTDDILVARAMEKSQDDFDACELNKVGHLFGKNSCNLWSEYRDSRTFSTLHEVLLGIDRTYGTLEDYLALLAAGGMLASMIDLRDSSHRSPLAWAVEYGWVDAIETLLKFGANAHQYRPSFLGGSPLLHLAIAGPAPQRSEPRVLHVVRLLIQAGVDINATDHEGWTPLHVAASWNLYDVLKELACFGGQVLNWDAKTDTGHSALELALNGGFDGAVMYLLRNRSADGSCNVDAADDTSVFEDSP